MTWHGIPVMTVPDDGNRKQWLELRREGIGASDVAAILGISPYGDPFSVWADKMHGVDRDANEWMDVGRRLEPVIMDLFEAKHGLNVGWNQLLIRHPVHAWAMATVDGIAAEGPWNYFDTDISFDDGLGPVEAKSDAGWNRWTDVPYQHLVQLQWQMFVSGYESGWLAVLHQRHFETYEVEADPKLQQTMFDLVETFFTTYLADPDASPPEPGTSDATAAAIRQLWPGTAGESIVLSKQMAADVDQLRGLKAQAKLLDDDIKRIANRIKVSMQDATEGTVDGKVVVTWRPWKKDSYTVKAQEGRSLVVKEVKK